MLPMDSRYGKSTVVEQNRGADVNTIGVRKKKLLINSGVYTIDFDDGNLFEYA